MLVVSTIKGKCKRCYNCVRNCPAKAITVKEGQAEVIEERCIACGTCVRVCAQKAKQIESHIPIVEELLNGENPVIACLAPSFPSAFSDVSAGQVASALKKVGFREVMEVSFGAQLISREYAKLVNENKKATIITSPCPAIVYLLEKYYPELLDYLAPIVSPMIAIGRLIKNEYDRHAKTVFIGPCIAKKLEMKDEKIKGVIDAVLTYQEMKEMLNSRGIDISREGESLFNGPKPSVGRAFAVSGGLLKSAALRSDILESDIFVTEGKDRVLEVVREKARGTVRGKFLDILFCEGCINGPVMDNELSIVARRDLIINYVIGNDDPEKTKRDMERYSNINLRREYTRQDVKLKQPTEEDIKEILAKVNKTKPEDELDCGSCGYSSCREKATAVYQGIAELEMCLPYLVAQTEMICKQLQNSHQELQSSHSESIAQLWQTYRELEATKKLLIQSEKLASMGQLAASVAHEINNPLSVVFTYAKLMKRKIRKGTMSSSDVKDFDKYLATVERETSRSGNIVKRLLDFARQSEPAFRPVNINSAVNEALVLLRNQIILQNVIVSKELSPQPEIMADFSQIQQVFVNIVLNSIQAMPKGGSLTISTGWDNDKKVVEIRFKDSGTGISPENISRIFDPFFTTKEKGTGLGLCVAYGIVNRHHGAINVESTVGEGSTFTVVLPFEQDEEIKKEA